MISKAMEHLSKTADAFHAHLDACPQCALRPFNLCPEGARLLDAAPAAPAARENP